MALPLRPPPLAPSGVRDPHVSAPKPAGFPVTCHGRRCEQPASALGQGAAARARNRSRGFVREGGFQGQDRTQLGCSGRNFHDVRWSFRRKKGGLSSVRGRRRNTELVTARLDTQEGADGTDASPFFFDDGRGPLGGLFHSARCALLDIFKTNDVGREIAALAVPAILAQVADPAAQIVETADAFRNDELGMEIAVIALPAVLALAADPLASLVDSAFIGRIGPVELAAVGVSISIFNLVSKMFNIPLLNVTTSFVAEDEAVEKSNQNVELDEVPSLLVEMERESLLKATKSTKPMMPAVSSSLVLGACLGLFEAAVLVFAAGPVLYAMGIPFDSPMRVPAEQYLALRAFGAPAVVVSLAVQGVFRGFKDTKTPLYSTVAGNVANIVLDPILMFSLHYGVSGAAIATVASQYLIVGMLLWSLNQRVVLLPPKWSDLKVERFLKSGGLLLGRTLAIVCTMTLATSMAARQGAIPMAAHQICLQIWLATSLLSDALALAGQAILAGSFASGDTRRVKEVAVRILQMGLAFGIVVAIILGFGTGPMAGLFTTDAGVLEIIPYLIPFVAFTQPINALAFVFDGLHYGASDFAYAAYTMMLTAIPSILVLLLAPRAFGLVGVWIGLTVIMTLRMVAGFARVGTASGPWRIIRDVPRQDDPPL